MKILHVSSVPISYPGGTEKVIWELARRQAKKNKVTILQTNLYEEKKKFKRRYLKEGIEIITCKNDFFLGGFGYSREFVRKLKEIWANFDIVHVHGHGRFTSNFSLKFLHKKKPIIYSPQGFFHDKKNSFFKKMYNLIFKGRLRFATFSTGLTENDYKTFESLGIARESVRIIPCGIETEKFREVNKKNILKFKRKYGLSKKTLLYVGRIHESKGLQYVIKSIKDIDCKLLVVGYDAGFKKDLTHLIEKLDLGDKVIFTGKLGDEDLARAYFSSDAFVLFSEWEGFGIVVLEAMASGLPVIVSDRGALPTLIKNRENGLIAKFPNVKELEKQIKLLFENKKLNQKIKKSGQIFVKNFKYPKISKQYRKLYEKAIKKNG